MNKLSQKLMAVILSVLMTVSAAPLQSMAEEALSSEPVSSEPIVAQQPDESSEEEQIEPAEAEIVREIEAAREESVKRFQMSDGTILAAQYPSAVHYLEDGQWKDIDNSLTEESAVDGDDEDGYQSAENPLQVKFAKKYDAKKLVKIKMDNYQLSWSFSGANSTKAKNAKVQTETDTEDAADEDPTNLKKLTSGVTYADIQDGVDLEYVLSSNTLKENIIVKKKLDDYSFELVLRPKKLTPVLREDNTIDVVNDAQEVVFQSPAPYMYDAAGAESSDVAMALTPDKKGKEYTLTITANTEWMNDEQRQFPVVIDTKFKSIKRQNRAKHYGLSFHPLDDVEGRLFYIDDRMENPPCCYFETKGVRIPVCNPDLASALASLTETQRTVLLQNAVLKIPVKKIARDLGLCQRSVEKHKQNAIELLRRRMQKYEE